MLKSACHQLMAAVILVTCAEDISHAQNACGVRSVQCDAGRLTLSETPNGLINDKNNVFTLTLTPASTSHILVFKTGPELKGGVDYQVDGRRILMIGPNIPQVGDLLTAVYSPASQTERKIGETSVSAGEFAAPSGDIADRALRKALELESRAAISENSLQGTETSRALRMLEDRQNDDPLRLTSRQINPGFDGLGDGSASSSPVRRAAQEPPMARDRLRYGIDSKALEMLNDRIALDRQRAAYSKEGRNSTNR